jgi:hypothetical protein
MRYGPVQDLMETIFRVRAGTSFQPRYIVGALFAFAGTGFVACAGVAAWLWAHM